MSSDNGHSVLVGTSGWHYASWRDSVYPPRMPARQWLSCLAREFGTVELNNSFYRLPSREAFAQWASEVPAGFLFAVKASRYLTHVRRLVEPAEPVARLLRTSEGLGSARGPFLLQLPPTLKADARALDRVLAAFGKRVQVAVEFRHPSWITTEGDVRKVLERRAAACVWSDRRGPLAPRWRTAPWGYVRLHEGRASAAPCYGRTALHTAAAEILDGYASGEQVFVYFNNDQGGCAVRNAKTLSRLLSSSRP